MDETKGNMEDLEDTLRSVSLDNSQDDKNGFTASVGAVQPLQGDVDTAAALAPRGLADLAGGIRR